MPWGSSDARRGWAAQWRNPHGPYRIVTLDPRQDVLREAVLGAIDEACFPLNTADEIPDSRWARVVGEPSSRQMSLANNDDCEFLPPGSTLARGAHVQIDVLEHQVVGQFLRVVLALTLFSRRRLSAAGAHAETESRSRVH